MNPLAINLIRTYVPVAVGAAVAWLTARGIHVQPGQAAQAITMMTAVFSAAYYTIVRVLEDRWPAIGSVLLLSRPAASLHVAGACPGIQEDYGDGWPPRDAEQVRIGNDPRPAYEVALDPADVPVRPRADRAPQPGPGEYHFPSQPSGSQVVVDQGSAVQPGFNDTRNWRPAATGPNPVRKAHTGEIPAYRRTSGR